MGVVLPCGAVRMFRDGIWRKPASAPLPTTGGAGVAMGEPNAGSPAFGLAGAGVELPPATMTLLRPPAACGWLNEVWIDGCTTTGGTPGNAITPGAGPA